MKSRLLAGLFAVFVGVLLVTWLATRAEPPSVSLERPADDGINLAAAPDELEPSADASALERGELDEPRVDGDLIEVAQPEADAPRASTRLLGRVVDESGAPVAGAAILAAQRDRGPDLPLDAEAWRERDRRRREALTDSEGRFALDEMRTGPTRIAVRSAEFSPLDLDHISVVRDVDNSVGDLIVARGVRLAGHVVDARGAPVEGALIVWPFDSADPSWRWRAGSTGITLATSAADGSFDVGPAAVGPWTLLVHEPRFPEIVLRGQTRAPGEHVAGLEARFEAAGSISGRVILAAGAAAPTLDRFSVQASYTGERQRVPGQPDATRRFGRCDAAGAFEITGLLADEPYALRVRWHRSADDTRGDELGATVDALCGDRSVELHVAPFAAVKFRPIDALTERALEGVDARLIVVGNDGRERGLTSTTSAAGGGLWRETCGNAPEAGQTTTLEVRHPQFRPALAPPVSLAAGIESDAGEVRLEPLGRLDVVVRDALSGAPLRGASVLVELASGDDGSRPTGAAPREARDGRAPRVRGADTNSNGRTTVYASAGATGVLAVTRAGHASSTLIAVAFEAAPQAPLEVALEPGASLRVSVVDDFGPVAGALVRSRWLAPRAADPTQELRSSSQSERTDAQGLVFFSGLTPGTVRVALEEDRVGLPRSPDERAQTSATLELAAGAEADVVLRATPRGELHGRVTQARQPLAGARIELRAGSGRDNERRRDERSGSVVAVSSADGRYSIPRLGAGRWSITVTHPARLVAFTTTLDFEGREREFDLVLPASVVVGRVTDTAGRAIEGARITLGTLRPDERNSQQKSWSQIALATLVKSDAAGAFELVGLPTGVELQLNAEHPRFQSNRSGAFVLQGDEIKSDLEIKLRLSATIEVAVLASDGRIVRAPVSVRRTADDKGKPVKSGARTQSLNGRGTTRFTGLAPGSYRVSVERKFGPDGSSPARTIDVRAGEVGDVRFDVP